MKSENTTCSAAALGAAALTLVSLPATALDLNGFTNSSLGTFGLTDIQCAFTPACSLSRGGVSDLMMVLDPIGVLVEAIVAFGNEEADNLYFFDPSVLPGNLALVNNPTFLTEGNGVDAPIGTFSDLVGSFDLGGIAALGFVSDPYSALDGQIIPGGIMETPGVFPDLVMEPGTIPTILYDASPYLDPNLSQQHYSAFFLSNVDVPEFDATSGTGALLLLAGTLAVLADRRKPSGKNTGHRPLGPG